MNEEINLLDYIKVITKNKFIILGFIIIGVLFSLIVIYFTSKTYQAKVIIEIGNMGQKSEQLVSKINYSFVQKYPSLKAIVLSDKIIEIDNYSVKKEEAEKGIADALPLILSDDDVVKNNIQARIDDLDIEMNKLIGQGQQIASIYLEISNLQGQLGNFIPAKVIQQSTALKKTINPLVSLLIGGILGLFIGIVFVFAKEWWSKIVSYVNIK